MRRLIVNAIAFADNAAVPGQMKDVANVGETYIRNSFVSLTSAKKCNPSCEVCLLVNQSLPDVYAQLFQSSGIRVAVIDYDTQSIPGTFSWQLAFFKLFAFHYALNHFDYDQYLILDTDTYCHLPLTDFWKEAENHILMYIIPGTYSQFTRKEIIDGYANIYGTHENLLNYGGEMIAGPRAELLSFSDKCMKIFSDLIQSLDKVSKNIGDEFVIAIAAKDSLGKILPANAYIDRYWTGRDYVCSSNYPHIAIWHLLVDKSYTMIKLFQYYNRHKQFPSYQIIAGWAGLPKTSRRGALPYYMHRTKEKMAKKISSYFTRH